MASNFAFQPMGMSRQFTIGTTPTTVSFNIVQLGGTTFAVPPPGVRLVNEGTASVYLQFAPNITATVGLTTGMKMLGNSVETFSMKGQSFMAAMCASTFTVTLTATPGEGM